MYYNKNGKKEHSEKFRVGGVSEGYKNGGSKWMYWLLAALVVIVVVLLIWWFIKRGSDKKKSGSPAMGYRFW